MHDAQLTFTPAGDTQLTQPCTTLICMDVDLHVSSVFVSVHHLQINAGIVKGLVEAVGKHAPGGESHSCAHMFTSVVPCCILGSHLLLVHHYLIISPKTAPSAHAAILHHHSSF